MIGTPIWKTPFVMILITTALLLTFKSQAMGGESQADFQLWLEGLRKEALAKGISETTLDKALSDVSPLSQVLKFDRNQPEFRMTLEEYLRRVVSENRVSRGREKLAENEGLLRRISQKYGVQPRFLIALWGIETDFGRFTGDFSVIAATATLAYDGRRSAFFRRELLHALRIIDEGHISPDQMKGSWAGATGQFHFMPSSFQKFAVDYDGDGRIDIWNNLGDAFASAANYLSRSGWKSGQSWGRELSLPKGFDRTQSVLEVRKPLTEWQRLGVRRASGKNLPQHPNLSASVIQPEGPGGRAFAVYDNYRAILSWNRSFLFGIAVGMLADRFR